MKEEIKAPVLINDPIPPAKDIAGAEELKMIKQWSDTVKIDYIVERDTKSLLKINNTAYDIGDLVLPRYQVTWRSINTETNTLFFADPKGNLYRRDYSDDITK